MGRGDEIRTRAPAPKAEQIRTFLSGEESRLLTLVAGCGQMRRNAGTNLLQHAKSLASEPWPRSRVLKTSASSLRDCRARFRGADSSFIIRKRHNN